MAIFLRNALLASVALLALVGQAQVVRCTDARTGAVSYTDGDCPASSKAREVQQRQTAEAIEYQRTEANQALERKQQRLQTEAAEARLDAEQDAQHQREIAARTAATRARPQDYARSPECARARRNLDMAASSHSASVYGQEAPLQTAQRQMELDCLGPEAYAEIEKNRPAAPAPVVVVPAPRPQWGRPVPPPVVLPPPTFTHCNVFRCYDRQGRSHTRP